jgi:hypothetical protein
MECYNCYVIGFIAGVAVQTVFYTAILLRDEYRDRRARRERRKREEIITRLKSAIPMSTSTTYNV